jgi:hypothetical protein
MSGVSNRLITHRERDTMKVSSDLATLQKQYDAMVKIAKRSLDADVDLSPAFERELTSLMRVVKSMGGKV